MKFRTKASPRLVALSTAAVIGIYSAGYMRTRTAAARFSDASAVRRPAPAALRLASAATSTAVHSKPRSDAQSAAGKLSADTPAQVPGSVAVAATADVEAAGSSSDTTPETTPAATADEKPVTPILSEADAGAPAVGASPGSAPAAPAKPVYKDGTYTGWGYSRHGNIQAGVVIENGRIANATIWLCMTRYPCSWIEKLPPQVAQRQSPDVDYVSGATESATAFYDGLVEALTKATAK